MLLITADPDAHALQPDNAVKVRSLPLPLAVLAPSSACQPALHHASCSMHMTQLLQGPCRISGRESIAMSLADYAENSDMWMLLLCQASMAFEA